MDPEHLRLFGQRLRRHLLEHILPFWMGPALDLERGGWMGWLSNDLQPDRSKPKGLIVHARILWTFSAVHQAIPDPVYRKMADRAYDYLSNRFRDTTYGGYFWRLDDNGKVLDASKKIYGQAFCIYALSEYCRAFSVPEALREATSLFDLLENHAHDPQNGGYWEVRRRDWSEAADTRLSDKDMNEKKSMNNQLHVLEACASFYHISKNQRAAERLRALIQIFDLRILDQRSWHLNHFFDERWQVRSDSYTFGHDIEASWLLCEAAEVLDDPALLKAVRDLALRMATAVFDEAIDPDGALCYEGKGGHVIDHSKECWPQAEAVVGFINAFQLSGQASYLEAAIRVWDYIEHYLADHVHGEWFWRIREDGKPDHDLPKVSEWKGPYHGSRACLEGMRRLEALRPRHEKLGFA
jgi:cellobiose epimerase